MNEKPLVTWVIDTIGDWGMEGPFLVVTSTDATHDDAVAMVTEGRDGMTADDLYITVSFQGDVTSLVRRRDEVTIIS